MPSAHEIEMLQAALLAGVSSRHELANLMAQVSHESMGLARLEEGFRYTRGVAHIPVRSVLREGFETAEAARLAALAGQPQELARLMYGGRLGNDDAGDGYLYRGRGYIQLTGEESYLTAGNVLNLDLVNHPELAVNRENAIRIALWYWGRVPQADRDDVTAATYAINGGDNGLEDRFNRFDAWHALLTPEFIADLEAGRILPGAGIAPANAQEVMIDGALRRFETGADVRQLQDDLRTLGIRGGGNRELRLTGSFGTDTEQAVRNLQEQHNLPVTGRADAETRSTIQDALQQPQRHIPANPGLPHIRPAGGHYRLDNDHEPEDHPIRHNDRAQDFPSTHRDYALFEAIRRQLPPGTSDEMAAHVMLEAKIGGVVHIGKLDEVIVRDGTAFVAGKTPGDMAFVALSDPVPSLQEALQRSAALDQQGAMQFSQFQEQQREINARGGPTVAPPGGGFGMG